MANLTITFTFGITTITVDTPDFPEEWHKVLDQAVQQAMGGRITALTRSSGVIQRPVFHWKQLPESQLNALQTFFTVTVSGAASNVTLVDWDGNSLTVRYLGGLENAVQDQLDNWRLDLRLAVI